MIGPSPMPPRARSIGVPRPAVALALVVFALVCASSARAADAPRRYLTVQGRVVDAHGAPLPGTWVFCVGSRRSSAVADAHGQFTLQIPGAAMDELHAAPLRVRVEARRKGWRFGLRNGAPELGLEISIAQSNLRVRSNDSTAVETVASSVALEGNPRALLTATFIGAPGQQPDGNPVPLDISNTVMLGGRSSMPEAPTASTSPASMSSPVASPVTTPGSPEVSAYAGGGALVTTPAPVSAAPPDQTAPAPTFSTVPAHLPQKWNAAGDAGGGPRVYHPADAPPPPKHAKETPKREPMAAAEPARRPVPAAAPAVTVSRDSAAMQRSTPHSTFAEKLSAPVASTPQHTLAAPPLSSNAAPTHEPSPPSASLSSPAAPHSLDPPPLTYRSTESPKQESKPVSSTTEPGRSTAASQVAIVSPPQPGSASDRAASKAAHADIPKPRHDEMVKHEPPARPKHDEFASAPPPAPAIPQASNGATVARMSADDPRNGPASDHALRPVIQTAVPGLPRPAHAPEPDVSSGPPSERGSHRQPPAVFPRMPLCDCEVKGTVEVQSDTPLTSGMEVVVAVGDAPDVRASVQLFMGSPRAFSIHPAPCGAHRLLLWTRSHQRYALISAEPRIECTQGGVQQLRLILAPVPHKH